MESTSDPKLYSVVCVSPPLSMQHSSSCGGGSSVGNGGFGCIHHTVTKYDTLAGVAIKYGVEVADVKRMNGLTTDIQMFARKSLQIPLTGRHPRSPILPNGNHSQRPPSPEITGSNRRYSDSFNLIPSLKLSSSAPRNISSSVHTLRDYYGLPPKDQKSTGPAFDPTQTSSYPILGHNRRSKSEANGFSKISKIDNIPIATEKGAVSDKSIEKLVRRRRSEVDLNNRTHEMLLKSGNPSITDLEPDAPVMVPLGSGDSSVVHAFSGVRKSSSAPTFQQSETNNNNNNNININNNDNSPSLTSGWLTSMLNFKAELQGLSISAIASPLFDGLPKPVSGRKSKAARD